jgi:pimeloyl-ACP methyl ester carboxylesterase
LEAAVLHQEAHRQHVRIIAPDRSGFGFSDVQPGRKLRDRRPDRFFERMAADLPPADRALLSRLEHRDRLRSTALEATRAGLRGAVHEYALHARPWGLRLEDVTHEIHLWHGELDANTPASTVRHLAATLPRYRATFHDDEGHVSVMLRHMEEIIAITGDR